MLPPISFSIRGFMTLNGSGSVLSCKRLNSKQNLRGNTSGRVAIHWLNLTKVGPAYTTVEVNTLYHVDRYRSKNRIGEERSNGLKMMTNSMKRAMDLIPSCIYS